MTGGTGWEAPDSIVSKQTKAIHDAMGELMQENNDLRAENLKLRDELERLKRPSFFKRLKA